MTYIADDGGFRAEVTYENINAIDTATPTPVSVTTTWPRNSFPPQPSRTSHFTAPGIRQKIEQQKKKDLESLSVSTTLQPPPARTTFNSQPTTPRTPFVSQQHIPVTTQYFTTPTPINFAHSRRITPLMVTPEPTTHRNSLPHSHLPSSIVTTNFHHQPINNPRPVLSFDHAPRAPNIQPPTKIPTRDQLIAHRPSLVQDGRHIPTFSQEKDQSSDRPFPVPKPLQLNQQLPNIADEWIGNFNQIRNSFQHKPVKPSPVQISYHKPNVPIYPGINFPSTLRHTQPDRRQESIPTPEIVRHFNSPTNQFEPIQPSDEIIRNPLNGLSSNEEQPYRKTKIQGRRIDFQEHIPVNTPSPNPFRVTLSGSTGSRSRTTSRGRVINLGSNKSLSKVGTFESMPTGVSNKQNWDDFESEISTEKETLNIFQIQNSNEIDSQNEILSSTTTVPTRPQMVTLNDSSLKPKDIQRELTTSEQITYPPDFTVHQSLHRSTTPIPVQIRINEPDNSYWTPLKERQLSNKQVIPVVFPPPLPGQHNRPMQPPKIYRYQTLPETSEESIEETALYNPNSPVFIKALGKGRTIPLLLPYPENVSGQRSHRETGSTSAAFFPYELSRKNSSITPQILSPIPIISLITR